MRQRLWALSGLVFVTLVACASSAGAQTVAVGPYYATPSWDQALACTAAATCPRFVVLANFSGAAVLDRETGLVWEQSPSSSKDVWWAQSNACARTMIGVRYGFRLPTESELLSLLDNGTLPPGHPFSNVQISDDVFSFNFYFTSTNDPSDSTGLDAVSVMIGSTAPQFSVAGKKGVSGLRWCVRGGVGVNSSQN